MKVLCIGQATYDITLPVDEYPIENEKINIPQTIGCGGGSASNVAYLLSKWNIDTSYAGIIGDDYYGHEIIKEFEKAKVDLKYLFLSHDLATPTSYIISNINNSTRTIIKTRDENLVLSDVTIEDTYDIIYFDGYEIETCKKAIKKNPKAIKIIDASRVEEGCLELCKKCDYIICSKSFAENYTNKKIDYENLETIVDIYDILKKDFKGKIIITLENMGSFGEDNGYKLVPSIKVESIDSTGAGDFYHGAFVYALTKKYGLTEAMTFSNITGALSTLKIGSRYSVPRYGDVMEIYDAITK